MKTDQKLQEYSINDETYYIQIDGIDDDRIFSLLDNDKNILITNLEWIEYEEKFQWFRLQQLFNNNQWITNFYIPQNKKLLRDEWFDYVEDGMVKLDFNPESEYVDFFHVRTLDGENNMLLKDGTYYFKEWIKTNYLNFNNGFINIFNEELHKDNLYTYDMEQISPVWFEHATASIDDNYNCFVRLDDKWNIFNCRTREYLLKNWYDGLNIDDLYDNSKYISVCKDFKYNYIDYNENLLLPEWYDYCRLYTEDFGIVYQKNQGYMYINHKGEFQLDKFYKGFIHTNVFELPIITDYYIFCDDINIVKELDVNINEEFDVNEDDTFRCYDHLQKCKLDMIEEIAKTRPIEMKYTVNKIDINHFIKK